MTHPAYPVAERLDLVDDLHGHPVPDPYRWLEDPAEPRTRQWLSAQHQLWTARAGALPGRDRLHARVTELSDGGLVTAPIWRGRRRFFLRQQAGQQYPVLYTVDEHGTERVLVDAMTVDPAGTTALDHWQPDLEGRLLAFQLSRRGDERGELSVLDVASGALVDGPIDRCRYSPVAWLPGGAAFYYVRAMNGDLSCRRVYLHRVGIAPTEDELVFGSGRHETTSYGLAISQDGRWLTVSASSAARQGTDLWIADVAASGPAEPEFRVVHEGVDARTALNVGSDGQAYLVSDLEAPRGRLCVADPADPRPGGWRELVAADPEAVIANFAILDGPELDRPLLLVGRVRHALSEIGVHDLATGARLGAVPLPGHGSVASMSAAARGHELWFTYTDSITPTSVYRYDARRGRSVLWAAAPGAQPPDPRIETRRLVATSADGTPVQMVVLARSGTAPGTTEPGPRPAILYGYGGFGIPLVPSYSSFALAWVQAGGVFVTAHLRGGGEQGEQWHRDGMLDRKQNVFDDFVAAAEHLVDERWTTPAQLGICGESNGGLLVGATVTQRPDLVAAAVCSAPLLDMVRYERSGLGPSWTGEYGSASDPDQLRWLLSYSPYHRVRAGVDYPAVLFTVFTGDTRVDPMHARKMCAALQGATAGTRPVLLRSEDDAGHGVKAADRAAWLAADMLAFLAVHTGLDLSAASTGVAPSGEPR